MEEHIIAAHCATIMAYMLISAQKENSPTKLELIDKLIFERDEADDNSNIYLNMVDIIRKFLVFMKIMVRKFFFLYFELINSYGYDMICI
jgi:hypothetical protein